ncbi:4Fe-4S ferredoxin [Deinococcus ruber]|uniref:4Fe-4S ferredoxin-type domain-containing protein n=1 Tax=Deinococcus ruber TaxID=1848197 RepID=A0A918CJA9_9DEIO|nr:4Fe-4S ferredoxin [Deinococcus ruber]GGR28192.1 hypothetical protein GCM10008957_44270 [Deinococcus ruber]
MTGQLRRDVLALPGLRALVRWRYARLLLQLPLLALALLAVYDGFSGSQLAGLNVATVSVWVQYRGLLALSLLLVGNVFCAACPLLLTRGPSRVLKRLLPQRTWPRFLRNKYLTLALTLLFLYSYEAFALWASPWLTAWLIVSYFAAALLTDSVFPAGTFCRYVCPLGNFNFALSSVSPTLIQAKDLSICASCTSKACLHGRTIPQEHLAATPHDFSTLPALPLNGQSGTVTLPGCETRLYVPTMTSTQDCTLCLNCVRACPEDNVGLMLRSPLAEAVQTRPRTDLALLLVLLTWAGLVNAFAMTPPYFLLARWLATTLGTHNEPVLLALILLSTLATGLGLTLLAARLSGLTLRTLAPLLMPLALAVWGGHALYHFAGGAGTLWPAVQAALLRLGLPLGPAALPVIARADTSFWLQATLLELALAGTLWAILQRFQHTRPGASARRLVPPAALALLLFGLALWLFAQPMQARVGLLT